MFSQRAYHNDGSPSCQAEKKGGEDFPNPLRRYGLVMDIHSPDGPSVLHIPGSSMSSRGPRNSQGRMLPEPTPWRSRRRGPSDHRWESPPAPCRGGIGDPKGENGRFRPEGFRSIRPGRGRGDDKDMFLGSSGSYIPPESKSRKPQ